MNSTATMVAYRKSSQSTFQAGEGRGHEELLAVDGVGRGELIFFLGEGKGGDHCQALVDDPVSTSTQATLTRLGELLKEDRGGGKEDKKSEGRRVGGV